LQTLALTPECLGVPNPVTYQPYLASAIAGRFAEIFESLI
jgi:hypothetical protein